MRALRVAPRRAALAGTAVVIMLGAGLVVAFDALLSARVHAGSDNALRLSVLLPYIEVGSRDVAARACGLAALATSAIALGLGLEIGTRRARQQPSGAMLRRIHRQLAVLTVALVVGHIVLPYTSSVSPFGGWPTALAPFDQPYSFGARGRIFESFGILAFYLFVLLGPTYYLLRRWRWVWSGLHGLTIAAYGLAVVHALFMGSDFILKSTTRVVLIAVQIPLSVLLARCAAARPVAGGRNLALIGAGVLSAAVVGLCAAAIAGVGLGAISL